MPHLVCYLTRQLRCDFSCIATAMELKSRLAGTPNPSAILRHFKMYKALGRNFEPDVGFFRRAFSTDRAAVGFDQLFDN